MHCRSCGTEIADKAIICYRCGAGTTDPVRKPVPVRPSGGAWPSLVIAIVPLLLALCLLIAADASAHPRAMTIAAGVSAALGAILLIARLLRRR
jgi:hypothetical protein